MSQDKINRVLTQNVSEFRSNSLIAMGSNVGSSLGDPRETLLAALVKLEDSGLVIRARSQVFRTPAFPPGNGADYANAAIEVGHNCDATGLLEILHQVEAAMGRTRKTRWGSRVLDLDLLANDQTIHPSIEIVQRWIDLPLEKQRTLTPDTLVLPHPRLQDRAFVLVPLAEIAANWRHPISGLSVGEMLGALSAEDVASVVPYE